MKPAEDPDLENRFTYHSPKPGQPAQYEKIRDAAKGLAYLLAEECVPGREHATALTKLDECVFWANASIARGICIWPPKYDGPPV